MLILVSIAVAVFGIGLAFRVYGKSSAEPLAERAPAVYDALSHKYWVDELYDAIVVRPLHALSQLLWRVMDVRVVDGIVNGVARTFEGLSAVARLFQTGFVGTYALFLTIGVAALVAHFLRH
jgi:NADH-quinone oxidoreductase subunit L